MKRASTMLRKSHDRVAMFCCNSQKIKAAGGTEEYGHVYVPFPHIETVQITR